MLIVLFLSGTWPPASADDRGLPIIKVALSDTPSIIVTRVLYEALLRTGHQMFAHSTGMRNVINDVNAGDAAIVTLQTGGLERRFENLIRVPVVIDHVEFTTYIRTEDNYRFSDWGDLAGLTVAYRWQNEFVANNIGRANAGKIVILNEIDDLWAALLNYEIDVVILPSISHQEHRYPVGIKKSGIIERLPCFTYVNKNYEYLVPLLEKAYNDMFDDGTMAAIYDSRNLRDGRQIVLHINSYNTQIEQERSRMEAIQKALENKIDIEYHSIYLNSNEIYRRANYAAVVSGLILNNYIARYPDLIIVSGNEALDYVLDNYRLLFINVPVLFFGVNGFDDLQLYGFEQYITGITETISFYETVNDMLRLYPCTKNIRLLNDYYFDKSIKTKNEIQKIIDSQNWNVSFTFFENKPFADILAEISELEQDTLVLIGSYISDNGYTFYPETEVQKMVSFASVNPVFCLSVSYIGQGTLGGKVSDSDTFNLYIASIAADILQGLPVSQIPVLNDSEFLNKWYFDYRTVQRFGIKIKTLAPGHIIINRTIPVWESNPLEFRLLLMLVLLLLIIISGLIIFLKILAKKSTEANVASVAKTIFLSQMSHEIRTPMNAILGTTELQLQKDNHPSETEESFNTIYSSGILLLNIINDILDLSKIEEGKLELVPVKYDIPNLIYDTMQLNLMRYKEKPIEFILDMDENTPINMFGDELRIKQILNNLLSNAFKYTDDGKVKLIVAIESDNEMPEKAGDRSSCVLVMSVSDTGQGMTKEQMEKLFEKYTRFNMETNYTVVGTGLGMNITKRLVELMNGKIFVESKPNEGSLFTVRLPQERIGNAVCGTGFAKRIWESRFKNISQKRKSHIIYEYMPYGSVLIVDDVESNLYVAKGMMIPYGLKIETAGSGFDAVNKIKNGSIYDIIFMDHMMPKMDGIEAVKIIRDMGYKRTIVVLTANAVVGQAEMFLSKGFDDFIAKPVDLRKLDSVLMTYVRDIQPPEIIEEARKRYAQQHAQQRAQQCAGKMPSAGEETETPRNVQIKSDFLKVVVQDIKKALVILEEIFPKIEGPGDDLQLYTITVHGMKSVMFSIGDTELAAAALRLEKAGNAGNIEEIKAETPMFRDALSAILDKITPEYVEKTDYISDNDTIFLAEKLLEIKNACMIIDKRAAKAALEKLKQKAWPHRIIELLDELSMCLLHGEFGSAVSIIENIQEN